MSFFIPVAYAYTDNPAVSSLISKLAIYVLNPFIELLFGVALILFLWGAFQYFIYSNDSTARQTGANHLLWGIVGMGIMFGVYGIIHLALGTFGIPAPSGL